MKTLIIILTFAIAFMLAFLIIFYISYLDTLNIYNIIWAHYCKAKYHCKSLYSITTTDYKYHKDFHCIRKENPYKNIFLPFDKFKTIFECVDIPFCLSKPLPGETLNIATPLTKNGDIIIVSDTKFDYKPIKLEQEDGIEIPFIVHFETYRDYIEACFYFSAFENEKRIKKQKKDELEVYKYIQNEVSKKIKENQLIIEKAIINSAKYI